MTRASEDPYLWDRTGPVDEDVAVLERLLGRYGAGGPARRAPPQRSIRRRTGGRRLAVAAAVLCAVALGIAYRFATVRTDSDPQDPRAVQVAIGASDGARIAPGEWLAAGAADATRLVIGAPGADAVGEITVAAGARLRVDEVGRERTVLFLASGRIEAFVSSDAAARFFQVRTPVTTCVDLGCRYELEVDADTAETWVRVGLGQIAFESEGRASYVPRGAEARAFAGGRLGTPRFVDLPFDLRGLLDAFDAAEPGSEARLSAAQQAAAIATMPRDTLFLWHMLADPDPRVVRAAEAALVRIAGLPPGAVAQKQIEGLDPAVWRAHVEDLWW